MSREFKLPDLGEGIHEGEIISVLVKEGDSIEEGQSIFEIETDKATVEVPSPFTGKVESIKCKPGDIVNVGDVLMTFSGEAEEKKAEAEEKEKEEEKKEEAAAKPEKPAKEKEEPKEEAKPEEEEGEKAKPGKAEKPEKKPEKHEKEGPVPAAPSTRRLARELGVDLHQVTPTGPEGLVTAEDVKAFASEGKKEAAPAEAEKKPAEKPSAPLVLVPGGVEPPPLPDFTRWGEVERIPVRSIRRSTAKQMALAWSQIPHVTSQDTFDITKLDAFRRKHKEAVQAKGGKLSLTVFALKAAATALRSFPKFNSTLDTASGEIILKKYYHIGVAVQADEGLIVPVMRDVDKKSITELAIELTDLVERTRTRKVSIEDMRGGTFTITNVGVLSPIINYPEVAILGMGQARMQPVVMEKEGGDYEITARLMLPISLTIDHRVLDGAEAIRFIDVIKEVLEDPDELLMMMV